ncbi:MAG TPA: glycosyltransferase [Caldilineaceae bacterium]|nr:glycosyltransferase [Caldilineaceae bacterium]
MSARPRVLQVIASSRGGGAVHVRDLALGLQGAGYAMAVAMPEDGGAVTREDFAALDFTPVPIAGGLSWAGLAQLRRLMQQTDLVHFHGARAAFIGRLAAWSLGRARPRLVYSVHGYAAPFYRGLRRRLQIGVERSLAPLADALVAVCHAEKEALAQTRVARPERITVVWNGIPVAALASQVAAQAGERAAIRRALGVPVEALLITTICRLYKPRDFPTLLHALAAVRAAYPTAHLLIAGDGPDRPAIEALVAQLNLQNAVTLAGWRTDIPALYAASDLYTLTTWGWEGLPLTILEAMAAGLPVAATCAGGVPEAVIDGETGILVERQNIASLEDALRRLLADEALRRRMGEAGLHRAQTHFRVETMVERMDRLYRELLARS